MRKFKIALVVFSTLIFGLWIFGRLTNAFQYFSVPTESNEPTYKLGTHFFASNLITPKRFDFICYNTIDPEYGKQIWFHRICGMPGDTVEIRKGNLFVNGINEDAHLNVKKVYTIPRKLIPSVDPEEYEVVSLEKKDSVFISLETIKQSALINQAKRYIGADAPDPLIQNVYGQEWTPDNFGPYIVPANSYFVLGDNRDKSQDSRYTGPVEKNRYVATVIR